MITSRSKLTLVQALTRTIPELVPSKKQPKVLAKPTDGAGHEDGCPHRYT
jgi:hypothetical protein